MAARLSVLAMAARLFALAIAPRLHALAICVVVAVTAVGCAGSSDGGGAGGAGNGPRIVAAENFWGSIASQLGGSKASVQSIITNPAQDPHSYEPTASDARTLATAQLAIINGAGYDQWAPRLLAANPATGRVALTVADVLHARQGANPHLWYDPSAVDAVATAITGALKKLDPSDRGYYDREHQAFERYGLSRYHSWIALIKNRYRGIPVGASESSFAEQAPALGLDVRTPASFMNAVSEGTDVTAQDLLTAQRQIEQHTIKVWIYDSQNATPQIQRLNALAQAARIPVVTITETLLPGNVSFQHWQVDQLQRIAAALHTATGR